MCESVKVMPVREICSSSSFRSGSLIRLLISSSSFRVKEHGQGQSSSGSAGGSGAGNAGGSRGTEGGENGRAGLAMGNVGGGGQRRGNNGGDEENNGGDNGRRQRNPSWWEREVMLFTIIMNLIQEMLNLCGAELLSITTTGSVIGFSSAIISLLAFVLYGVIRRHPYSNPRVARILNPRIIGILSRTGSALAVLGFISRMAIYLPLHLSWIFILAFLALLIIYLVDIL